MYYRIVPKTDELYHHGVIGMHWGIRRYQNYDGTRISSGSGPVYSGKRRSLSRASVATGQGGQATGNARLAANANSQKKSAVDVIAGPNVKKGKGKENSSHLKEITQDIGTAAEGLGKVADDMKKHDRSVQQAQEKQTQSQRQKARQMSDKELRDSINRIKMEREYVSLTTKEVETGYDKFKDVMNEVKDVAVTAAAVAGLVLTIIKIKNSLGIKQSAIDEDDMHELYDMLDGYDNEFIAHAMNLDLDYIMDYFDLTEEDIQHMLEDDDELYHHGIKGMHWGVRRYQDYDGSRIGAGNGAGGGGGGSVGSRKPSRKLAAEHKSAESIKREFQKSIAGGQGGKAKGNAQLAAKASGGGDFFAKHKAQMEADKRKREEERKAREHQQKLEKERKDWSRGGWTNDYNEAANTHNVTIAEINKKYEGKDLGFSDAKIIEDYVANVTDDGLNYLKEMDSTWKQQYSDIIRKNHSIELGDEFVQNAPFMTEFEYMVYVAEESRAKKGR